MGHVAARWDASDAAHFRQNRNSGRFLGAGARRRYVKGQVGRTGDPAADVVYVLTEPSLCQPHSTRVGREGAGPGAGQRDGATVETPRFCGQGFRSREGVLAGAPGSARVREPHGQRPDSQDRENKPAIAAFACGIPSQHVDRTRRVHTRSAATLLALATVRARAIRSTD